MKQIEIPKSGSYFVTAFPFEDANICYPQCIHKTKRATKIAQTKLANSGGNTLLCSVNGKIYGIKHGSFKILLSGEFDYEELINESVDFSEPWTIK